VTDPRDRLKDALADRYAIEQEIGRGGMATVYLARDLKHQRPVAVKVLAAELASVLGPERFLREIEVAAGLSHPHILPVHDSGEADGLLYFVMPYVEGESLRTRLDREKQLPVDDALRISREVADALSYAHSRGVIHRDIKPENILLQSGHAVVADFGIARAVGRAGGETLTGTGIVLGTPTYISPEQAAGSPDLDGRSDLYSLGCVLYEMLAGHPPFMGPTTGSLLHQHLAVEPPSITALRPAVPPQVAAALQRALAKTPADRFSPVALFAQALGSGVPSGASSAVAAAAASSVRPSWRRVVLAGMALVVLMAGAVAVGRWMSLDPHGPGAAGLPPRTAIAVLPFENLSGEGSHAYFAGGLHDELLTQLSKVAALTVMGRTSVMAYAGTVRPLWEIATELGVGSIVEGSVQVLGNRLRVNVQLLEAATGGHLWAESYDRTMDDAFAIQSEIAQQVVAAVGGTLGARELQALSANPTTDSEAYLLYLQGMDYYRRSGTPRWSLEAAEDLFERALALDSTFALAWAALSETHGQMSWARFDPSQERVERQREAAEMALRLAPELPRAHAAMGLFLYFSRRDWQGALDAYAIALEGLPNDAGMWARIGFVHRRMGNWEQAIAAMEKAAVLDPRYAEIPLNLANTYRVLHRYPEAVRSFDRAWALAPDLPEGPGRTRLGLRRMDGTARFCAGIAADPVGSAPDRLAVR
jgi:eukaryotic-like serine/threonine-protein kinase